MTISTKAYVFLFMIIITAGCTGELLQPNTQRQDVGFEDLGDQTTLSDKDTGVSDEDGTQADDVGGQMDLAGDTTEDVIDPCVALNCQASEICDEAAQTCICREGYVDSGNECVLAPPGDPATRTKADMCATWTAGSTSQSASPWDSDGQECGPGIMPRMAIDDTIRRINAYRRLSGLANGTDNPDAHASQMECAAMMSKEGALSHTPGPHYACYTEAGAGAAGGLPGTLKITRDNWDVSVDETYRVTITGLNGGDLTYEVSPVDC